MMHTSTLEKTARPPLAAPPFRAVHFASALLLAASLALIAGCGTTGEKGERDKFFTSGSREADQRAAQRMAKAEQLESAGAAKEGKDEDTRAEEKLPLFQRLGGEAGIARIVDDFVARAIADPRVNWERKGVEKGGFFRRDTPVTWSATSDNVLRLKKHFGQFLAVASGGPARYEGKDMKAVHADLKITNAEFDAAVGDLKASLDRLQVPDREQKELLAIVESTRPQVVTER